MRDKELRITLIMLMSCLMILMDISMAIVFGFTFVFFPFGGEKS